MTVFICFDAGRSHQSLYFDSFCNSTFNLCRKGSHICHAAAVNDADFFSPQTFCGTDSIHRYVTTTDNGYFLSGKIRVLVLSYITKELNSRKDPF